MVLAVGIGAVNVPAGDVWTVLVHHVTGRGPVDDIALDQIVWQFRTPRVVLAAVVGAGLAVAGAVLQTLVSNPLADPTVLGFSHGASLGAVLVITLGGAGLGGLGVSGAAFVGALLAGLLVFALGQRRGRLAPTRLVLAGVAVGYVLLSTTSFVQLQAKARVFQESWATSHRNSYARP
ncbi:FecCD family ABC transporter permease [Streptomyces poriferorum]|uniref:FecCD family ABC transporter permease n=1 Tax=Streptomyces poriferorum TaxID=2798799 RepID=UPI0021F81163|nr:iron ABC transporter permease [Streptomyces poriferorum]